MKVTRTYVPLSDGIELVHTVSIGGRTLEARARINERYSSCVAPPLNYVDRELQHKIMRTIEKELYSQ